MNGEPPHTTTPPALLPPGVDPDQASVARVYDYLLGGRHHFDVDRAAAAELEQRWPDARAAMHAQRAFLRRAVRYLARAGIHQFLDIGSGIPTTGNVHEIAQAIHPDARVVYADVDPVAVAHARMILREQPNPNAEVILADVRQPERILAAPDVIRLLDLTRPVAVLLCYILHFLPDEDDPAAVVAAFRDALAPGSAVVLSHGSLDGLAPDAASGLDSYRRSTADLRPRTREEITRLLAGLETADPGVVFLSRWRPDEGEDTEAPAGHSGYAAVGWNQPADPARPAGAP